MKLNSIILYTRIYTYSLSPLGFNPGILPKAPEASIRSFKKLLCHTYRNFYNLLLLPTVLEILDL